MASWRSLAGLVAVAGMVAFPACEDQSTASQGSAPSGQAAAAASASSTAEAPVKDSPERKAARQVCHAGVGAMLAALPEPLTIQIYVSRQSARLSHAADGIAQLLASLESQAKGKVSHEVIDAGSAAGRDGAKAAGLQTVSIAAKDKVKLGYLGMVFRYGATQNVIPLLDPKQLTSVEFWIANKVREVRHRHDATSIRVGVVTGKEEIALTEPSLVPHQGGRPGPNLMAVLNQNVPFYNFADVDLSGEIDSELRALVITQPGRAFSDDELKRIDAYLMKGRSLAIFASAVNVKAQDATMTATVGAQGLDRLLAGYGIELKSAVVLDPATGVRLPVRTQGGGVAQITTPAILQLDHQSGAPAKGQRLDNSFAGFFRLQDLAFPFCSPLAAHPDKQPDARMRVVARSSPEAVTNPAVSQKLGLNEGPSVEGEKAQRDLAIVVEGKLRSAFVEDQSAEARLLVVSSAQFLVNPFARAGNPPPLPPQMKMMGAVGGDAALLTIAAPYTKRYLTATILAFTNVLDWMAADERLIACSALLAPSSPEAERRGGAAAVQ